MGSRTSTVTSVRSSAKPLGMGRAATATLSSPRSRTALGDPAAVAIPGLLGTRPGVVSKIALSLVGQTSLGKSAYQARSPTLARFTVELQTRRDVLSFSRGERE